MADFVRNVIERAAQAPKRVALPETESAKTLRAAREILDLGIATPVLVNDPAITEATAREADISLEGMELVDTTDAVAADALVKRYLASERVLSEKAYRRKIEDSLHYGMMLEAVGDVDRIFCGHTHTTGEVLMAALGIIGMKEGVDVASIMAVVEVPGFNGPEGDTVVFADCGLNVDPTPEKLASIVIAACDNTRSMLGWEPRAALVSFSTDGSGKGASVEKIQEALSIVHERRPDLKVDGEFQLDAALVPEVAATKVKRSSEVAGRANVIIFPDLDAANIAVKIIQLFTPGLAFGHTLSGFAQPVADSSRGASVEEMVGDIAMLVLAD